MKPANILMAGPVPKITDFGIGGAAMEAAQLDDGGSGAGPSLRMPTMLQTAGSSKYAPQEQAFGSPPNPRDDVYALGVIAYQLIRADLRGMPGDDVAHELRALRIPTELVALITRSLSLDPQNRPKDATEWERRLAALVRKKTASAAAPAPIDPNAPTEPLDALGESQLYASSSSQTIEVRARGRWYARVAGQMQGDWKLVAATPAEVRIKSGEVYRFSVHSAASDADIANVGRLAGLTSLRYLNLSFCDGVTDAGLARLPAFVGVRQLFLRGCRHITDAGLGHLHAMAGLHTLDLSDCAGLTAAGIAAVRDALPNCKVTG